MRYVKIRDKKLYTPILKYKKDDVEITAIGAVHVGTDDYYRELQKELDCIPEGLFEGVKPITDETKIVDSKRKYTAFLNNLRGGYMKLAKYANMRSQKGLKYGERWQCPDITMEEFINECPVKMLDRLFSKSGKLDIFEHAYKKHPKELARLMKGQMLLSSRLLNLPVLNKLMMKMAFSPSGEKLLMKRRNDMLFDSLESRLEKGGIDKLGIIYGAAHLDELDKYLKRKGFKVRDKKWLPAWEMTGEESGMSYFSALSKISEDLAYSRGKTGRR